MTPFDLREDACNIDEFLEEEQQIDLMANKLAHDICEFEYCNETYSIRDFIIKLRDGNMTFRYLKSCLDENLEDECYTPSRKNYAEMLKNIYNSYLRNENLALVIMDEIERVKEAVKEPCKEKAFAMLYNPTSANLFESTAFLFVGHDKNKIKQEANKYLEELKDQAKGELIPIKLYYEKDYFPHWVTITFKDKLPEAAYIMSVAPKEARNGKAIHKVKFCE